MAATAAAALARVTLLAWFSFRTCSLLWISSRTIVATPWRISAHSRSIEVRAPNIKVSGKYTHPALYRPVFRICRAHMNEDRLLFSSFLVQRGTRRGHSPASSILFRLRQAILQTTRQCKLEADTSAKGYVVFQTALKQRPLTASNFAVLDNRCSP